MDVVEEIKLRYPLPIAKLYEAMRLESEPRLRVRKLIDLFEGTSHYLALIGLAGYIHHGLSDLRVEEWRAGLEKPSLGHWVNLLKTTALSLNAHDISLLAFDPNHTHRNDPIFQASRILARIAEMPTNFKRIKVGGFLDTVVQFRNKKIGHGALTTLDARQVLEPLEEALIQWLGGMVVLSERHLVHIARVEWQDPHMVYTGTNLNCGTTFDPASLTGKNLLTHNRVYLHDPVGGGFLYLYPLFVYDPDIRVLYIYDELSTQRQLTLRCPYEAPGLETTHHLAIDTSVVLGPSLGLSGAAEEDEEKIVEPETVTAESIEPYLITDHPTNTNLYLTHFLKMYSQSRISNKGTRGYDPLTYTPIKLDEALAPAITNAEYALVVISGNAGDGKTAFIQRFERGFRDQGAVFVNQTSNGSIFTWQNREYRTVYDGSQDEGATGSNDVLDDFFAPFRDDSPTEAHDRIVRVIAINEGRLLHFLSNRQDAYGHLYEEIREQLAGKASDWAEIIVVNLNRRSVVDGRILDYQYPESWSILDRLLDRLLDDTYWTPCETCSIVDRCPVKFNVDTFRDPAVGSVVRQRLKFLFQITHFRHRVHITIRELRSALAYMLFGIRECSQIMEHIDHPEDTAPFFYYNSIFTREEKDRLLNRLAELDVAEVANPQLDNQLNFTPPEELSVMLRGERRAPADMPVMTNLFARRPQSASEASAAGWALLVEYHAAIRRKFFFENGAFRQLERQAGSYDLAQLPEIGMVPTRHILSFASFLVGAVPAAEVLDELIRGLNHSEGMHRSPYDCETLCLRTSEGWGQVKAFGLFPKGEFEVRAAGMESETDFVEYIPDAILLIYQPHNHQVEISLDLFEAILRMRDGYQPSTAELKGFFQNLQMFKKQVLGWGSSRMAILPPEGAVVNLVRASARSVVVELA